MAGGRGDARVLSAREFVEKEAHIKSREDLFPISRGSRSTLAYKSCVLSRVSPAVLRSEWLEKKRKP